MAKSLNNLWARGAEFLGCPYAIMGGAMLGEGRRGDGMLDVTRNEWHNEP